MDRAEANDNSDWERTLFQKRFRKILKFSKILVHKIICINFKGEIMRCPCSETSAMLLAAPSGGYFCTVCSKRTVVLHAKKT